MKKLYACLLVCGLAPQLFAALPPPTYDGFNYPPVGNTGWAPVTASNFNAQRYSWNSVGYTNPGTVIAIAAQNLSVPSLAPSTGNSIRLQTNGNGVRFSLPSGTAVTSGTLYYSFALQVEGVGTTLGIAPSGGGYWAGFNNTAGQQQNTPTVLGTKVLTRATIDAFGNRDGGYNIGLSKASTTASDFSWDSRRFTPNDVVFIVGSYTFNTATTSDDVSQLWINPSAATFGAGAAPPPDLTNAKGTDLTPAAATFVFLQRNRPDVQPASSVVDELRIGNTWPDV